MSCYEWESGTIKIPAKAWSAFRKALIKAWNDRQDKALDLAKEAYKAINDKSNSDLTFPEDKFYRWAEDNSSQLNARNEERLELRSDIFNALREPVEVDYPSYDGKTYKKVIGYKIRLPTAACMKYKKLTESCVLNLPDATISLDNENQSVRWNVPENNRARERARRDPIAQLLFSLLGKIEWSRGSGGEIVGNDEYRRDNRDPGGGGNYVVTSYRPLSKKEKEDEKKRASMSRYPSYSYGYGGRPRLY